MRRLAPVALIASTILMIGVLPAWAATVSKDTSFSGDGIAKLDLKGVEYGFDVVADADRYYLVGGTSRTTKSACSFFVARYLENGRLDPSFGGDGTVTRKVGVTSCATSAAITADGKLLVAGWAVIPNKLNKNRVYAVVAKFQSNGRLDTTFGDAGLFDIQAGRQLSGVRLPQVQIEPDGSIWLAWSELLNRDVPTSNYRIAHLHPRGTLDRDYAKRGIKTVNLSTIDAVADSTVTDTGRLILTGWSAPTKRAGGVAAVVSTDNPRQTDTRRVNIWGDKGTSPVSVDVDATGKLVLGLTPTKKAGWGAVRLEPDLGIDQTYGRLGVARHDCSCYAYAGVLTDNGLILFGATAPKSAATVAARFTADGNWDPAVSGSAKWNFFNDWEMQFQAVVDDAGRIVLATSGKDRTVNAGIARLVIS